MVDAGRDTQCQLGGGERVDGKGAVGAVAYTTNHVNSLVDGVTVVTGNAYGPEVNYAGAGSSDILADYVAAAFARAGYTSVIEADSRWYHNSQGNIHCGTNVRRAIPAYLWWEK